MIVIDCSIVISSFLPDEFNKYADEVFTRIETCQDEAVVPFLFYAECFNTLLMAYKRKRINTYCFDEYTQLISKLPFEVDTVSVAPSIYLTVCELCKNHNLTYYDALYLELAIRRNIPLATLDKTLSQAAEKHGLFYKL